MKIVLLLLVFSTSLLSGCASFDKSMSSDAVDIPDDTRWPNSH